MTLRLNLTRPVRLRGSCLKWLPGDGAIQLAHPPTALAPVIREPQERKLTLNTMVGGSAPTSFSARFDPNSLNQGCRHIGRRP